MKITLYKECRIRKNDVIEKTDSNDILTYLDTLEKVEINNVNLSSSIFSNLVVNIKLNRQLKKIDVYSYNYALIEYFNDKYFYFIADKKWVADSTTNFVLFLDTCNTFEYKDTIISDTSKFRRCNVIREHRDRFNSLGTPIIDKIDEGFGTLPMEIKNSELLGDLTNQYYLGYYKTSGTNSRTVCKVFNSTGEDHTMSCYNIFKKLGDYLASGEAVLIYTDVNKTFIDLNATPNSVTATDFWDNKNLNFIYIERRTASDLGWKFGYWVSAGKVVFTNENENVDLKTQVDYYSKTPFKVLRGKISTHSPDLNIAYTLSDILGTYKTEYPTGTGGLNYSVPVFTDNLKADNNILKIIEVPYFNDSNYIPYYDFGLNTIISAVEDINKYIFSFESKGLYNVTLPSSYEGVLADKKYETKLLSSQFTNHMFSYDSFNYNIAAEDLTLPQTSFNISSYIPVDMSTTVGFKFDYIGTRTNNYDRWLLTQRNNQVPTLNNDYLEYMQSGYNYDVKNRNIQSAVNWASFAGQVVTAGLTDISPVSKLIKNRKAIKDLSSVYTYDISSGDKILANQQEINKLKEGSTLASMQLYNSTSNVVSGLANNVLYEIQSKRAIDERKKDYLNSAINISNSDDITLFHEYNGGNRLRYSKYQPRDEVINSISNVLRLSGYSTNQYKTPNLNSRWYYNFLQADIEYNGGLYIPNVMLQDICNSVSEGVTLFHNHNGYDLDRKYENWEYTLTGGGPSPTPGPSPEPGDIQDFILKGDTVLKDDGYFYYVSYSIYNPNNFSVTLKGTFKEDAKTILQDFTLQANETISNKLEVDGKFLTLDGTLIKKED